MGVVEDILRTVDPMILFGEEDGFIRRKEGKMVDKCTLIIDCDLEEVEILVDAEQYHYTGKRYREQRSLLMCRILARQVKELNKYSTEELLKLVG